MATETKKPRKIHQWFKDRYPDCILLFRINDHYKGFFEDAEFCSSVCDLPLEHLDNRGDVFPVVNIPFWEIKKRLKEILQAGHKVSVCEQVEGPQNDECYVIRIMTPGTVNPHVS